MGMRALLPLFLCALEGMGLVHHATEEDKGMGECFGRNSDDLWKAKEDGGRQPRVPVIFFHISSHAGRTFAAWAGNSGWKSKLYCRWDGTIANNMPDHDVWAANSWTDLEDPFGSWDPVSGPAKQHNLDELQCGSNSAIFATSMRHPINLLFSSAGNGIDDPFNSCGTDNIALRSLVGKMCVGKGLAGCVPLTRDDLELAKFRARQMDVIFILEHMNETEKLGFSRLGCVWENRTVTHHQKTPDLDRQLTPEIWNALWERNALGIELFEYMKKLSFDMLKKDGLPVPPPEEESAEVPHQDQMRKRERKESKVSSAQALEIERAVANITSAYASEGQHISRAAALQQWSCMSRFKV